VIALAALMFLLAVSTSWGSAGKNAPRFVAWSHGHVAFTSYEFSTLPSGARESMNFRLTNLGRAVPGKFAIRLTGSSAFSMRASGCRVTRKSCRVTVAYAPSGAGARDHAVLTASAEHRTAARLKISGCSADASGHLYWLNGSVNKGLFAAGCTPKITTLARSKGYSYPASIAVDNTHVYWTDIVKGTVNEVPVGGGSVTTLASGQHYPISVAVDGTHVYWVNQGSYFDSDGTVSEVPIGGGSVTTLASGVGNLASVAVDGTHVYWADLAPPGVDGTVDEVPVGGGSVTTLASGQEYPISVAVDGAHVYWVNESPYYPGAVNEVPVGGGSVTILASDGAAGPLAVDDSYVYWSDYSDGALMRAPLGGGSVKTLVRGQSASAMAVGP
jgi:hypothetical protein